MYSYPIFKRISLTHRLSLTKSHPIRHSNSHKSHPIRLWLLPWFFQLLSCLVRLAIFLLPVEKWGCFCHPHFADPLTIILDFVTMKCLQNKILQVLPMEYCTSIIVESKKWKFLDYFMRSASNVKSSFHFFISLFFSFRFLHVKKEISMFENYFNSGSPFFKINFLFFFIKEKF